MNTTLVGREAIVKNTANKRKLTQLLYTHNLGPNVTMVSKADSLVKDDEADISLVSFMLNAVRGGGAHTVQILCEDTDVFVLLVY